MCLTVLIGAHSPLPLISLDQSAPAFHTMPLSPETEDVRRWFSKPYICEAMSALGCAGRHDLYMKITGDNIVKLIA